MNLTIQVCDGGESLAEEAAACIYQALSDKADLMLCAAGGSTPLRTYQLLGEHCVRQLDAFRSLRVVKLDEWGGIEMNAPGSCERQLRTHLISPLGITEDHYLGFNSNPTDPDAECERVRQRLAAEGPVDLCVLGLGMNGHIAMNEPAPSLRPFAHIARLADATLRHPMLAESRTKPAYGLTLGMAEILTAREILLLVSGEAKREPLRQLLRREITTKFPASFLWLHSRCTVLCDRAAAEGLDLAG